MLLESSFSTTTHKRTQVLKYWKQQKNSHGLFFLTHHTAQTLLHQISTSLETSKIGKGLGLVIGLVKK
jgi:hypothetical protein